MASWIERRILPRLREKLILRLVPRLVLLLLLGCSPFLWAQIPGLTFTQIPIPQPRDINPQAIGAGAGGRIWFTDQTFQQVGYFGPPARTGKGSSLLLRGDRGPPASLLTLQGPRKVIMTRLFGLNDNNPNCDANVWIDNQFQTANQGCVH
jgi:hypothetical protein